MKTWKYHLSLNSKLEFPDFSTTLDQCSKNCQYYIDSICYVKNNPRLTVYNRKKYLNNEKLLNSKDFIPVIKKAILRSNYRKIRFFTSGDLYELSHLEKIIKLCQDLPNIQFWLSTHNEYLLNEYYKNSKNEVKNLNIILSFSEINVKFPEFLKLFWNNKNIYVSETTDKKSKSNCQASINHTSCGLCENCFNGKNIIYKIHGKNADKRLMRLKNE